MWELSHKEGWAPKNSCFWTVVLEKSLESHLDCKEFKPVHPKGNQCWMTDAGVLILWPPHVKSRLIGKDPDAGKDWRQKKGMAEDKMVGRHHLLNGHEFEQTLGDGEGQGGVSCCSPWGRKESGMTWWLNNNNNTGWMWCWAFMNPWVMRVGSRVQAGWPAPKLCDQISLS